MRQVVGRCTILLALSSIGQNLRIVSEWHSKPPSSELLADCKVFPRWSTVRRPARTLPIPAHLLNRLETMIGYRKQMTLRHDTLPSPRGSNVLASLMILLGAQRWLMVLVGVVLVSKFARRMSIGRIRLLSEEHPAPICGEVLCVSWSSDAEEQLSVGSAPNRLCRRGSRDSAYRIG